MIMITCVMKVKENTSIILLYEKNKVKCLKFQTARDERFHIKSSLKIMTSRLNCAMKIRFLFFVLSSSVQDMT